MRAAWRPVIVLASAGVALASCGGDAHDPIPAAEGWPSPAMCPDEWIRDQQAAPTEDGSEPPSATSERDERIAWARYSMQVLEDRDPDETWLLTVSFLDDQRLSTYEEAVDALEDAGMEIEAYAVRGPGELTVWSFGIGASIGASRDRLEEHLEGWRYFGERRSEHPETEPPATYAERDARENDAIGRAFVEDRFLVAGVHGRGTTATALEIAEDEDVGVGAITTRCGLSRGPSVIEPEIVHEIWSREPEDLDGG